MEKYPDNNLIADAQKQLAAIRTQEAERDYQVGWFYWKTGKNEAARKYFQSVITNYPDTEWARRAEQVLTTPPFGGGSVLVPGRVAPTQSKTHD